MSAYLEPWMVLLAAAKGVLMVFVIIGIASTGFFETLAVAVCSAVITGMFLVLAAYIQAKHTGHRVEDVQTKVEEVAKQVSANEENS